MAWIWAIFGPNESSRRDLFFENFSNERNERKDFKKFENFSKNFGKIFANHVRIEIISTRSNEKRSNYSEEAFS